MRSRFSAARHDITDYLVTSLHPSKRLAEPPPLPTPTSPQAIEWLHLRIVETRGGTAEDDEGSVAFVATYRRDSTLHQLRERSEFLRQGGRWYYLDGETEDRVLPPPGRNSPCWCGSGKKLKKCHGPSSSRAPAEG